MDSTRTSCSSSVVFVFMPRLPLRCQLLDELEDQDRSFKRARLFKYLKDVSFENLLVPTSDGESDNSDTSSSTSSSTTTSSRDSDESASQGILSDLSEIEEIYIQTCLAKIDVLRQVILASRVLREHPPVKKASLTRSVTTASSTTTPMPPRPWSRSNSPYFYFELVIMVTMPA